MEHQRETYDQLLARSLLNGWQFVLQRCPHCNIGAACYDGFHYDELEDNHWMHCSCTWCDARWQELINESEG